MLARVHDQKVCAHAGTGIMFWGFFYVDIDHCLLVQFEYWPRRLGSEN